MRSQSTNNESSSGGKDKKPPAATALAPAAAAVFGGAAEQPATGKKMDTTDHGQSKQSEPDDEGEKLKKLKDLSPGEHVWYKELEKQVAEIMRDSKDELRIPELTPAERIKFYKLVDQMAEMLDAAEVAAASTSAAVPASHEGVASVAGSAAFAFLTRGAADGNAVLDQAMLRFRQGS